MIKGSKHTDETKEKMRSHKGKNLGHIGAMLGKHHSEETKLKIGVAGKKRKEKYGYYHSAEGVEKIRVANIGNQNATGHHHTLESKEKIAKAMSERIISDETINRMSSGHIGQKSWNKGKKFPQYCREGNPNWKGGLTPLRTMVMSTPEYDKWRGIVFQRDEHVCQECGKSNGDKHAHHIIPFHVLRDEAIAYFPLLDSFDACMLYDKMWDTNNGITLCEDCHKKIHSGEIKCPKQHHCM